MDTSKVYEDSKGNKCSIWQRVRREPDWAANRIQEGEKAIKELATLKDASQPNKSSGQAYSCPYCHSRDRGTFKCNQCGRKLNPPAGD